MFNFRLKLTDRKTTRYVARGKITKNIEERADCGPFESRFGRLASLWTCGFQYRGIFV